MHHGRRPRERAEVDALRAALAEDGVLIALGGGTPTIESARRMIDAARRGKQVAVLVEITARFDEAPNIAWGKYLEQEGVHVAYGVEKLKTHVKGALVVREEGPKIRRYAHVGTGNYHTGTARIYEDLGVLTAEPEICADVAAVFNSLTMKLGTMIDNGVCSSDAMSSWWRRYRQSTAWGIHASTSG